MQTGEVEDERRALEASQQALQLAQEDVDPDVVFAALHARQMALSGPAGVEERLLLAERVRKLSRETDRLSMAQWAHAWRVDALVQLCRIDEAEVELGLQARLADQLREPLLVWRTRVAQATLATLRGRFDEAQRLADEARLLGRKGHHPPAEFLYAVQSMIRAIHVGGLESALETMDGSEPSPSPSSALFRAGAMAIMGRLEDARTALNQVTTAGLENVTPPPLAWLPAMALLAEAVSAVRNVNMAPSVYMALLPYAGYNVTTGAGTSTAIGSVSRYLGILAATLERWDPAAEHFEQALAVERRMGAPPFVVRTQVAYAEMLVRRGRDADLHHARQLLDAAIVTSRKLGMKPWLERAEALGGAVSARGIADHPLSSRELEVATLVAEGLSNRAIAQRLHLSERTAESHVKNICDKLGFNSRSQVAAWVAGRHPAS
jgi:ATP/maltotriose-dependent transcriptional regulator MalT